jgi:ribulose kinase
MLKLILKVSVVFAFLETSLASSAAASGSSFKGKRPIVIGVDGGTESVRACCFDAKTGVVVGKSCSAPYKTYHPQAGWAEQDPVEWWECLGAAVRGAVDSISNNDEICGLCVDTTCCSVLALDQKFSPLRRCLLWMDQRSAQQTTEIMDKCVGDPALNVNSGGEGPISAEWMLPKALWLNQKEPDVWKEATTICEYQDYINYKLTNTLVASSCNAATRWHFDGEECIKESTEDNPYPGRPNYLYQKLGIPELASKLPQKCIPMGALVGPLTSEAAQHLNLPQGVPVAQGGADAFVGMIGLGCVNPGQVSNSSTIFYHQCIDFH